VKIALIGNPNCGKTTVFNRLTFGRGKVGNMPGVTVDALEAKMRGEEHLTLVDLPGTYSLYAQSEDERITQCVLFDPDPESRPDAIWLVVDSAQLRSSLFLVLQALELQFIASIVINQTDDTPVNITEWTLLTGIDVVTINAVEDSTAALKQSLLVTVPRESTLQEPRLTPPEWDAAFTLLKGAFPDESRQRLSWYLRLKEIPTWLTRPQQAALSLAKDEIPESSAALQLEETGWRMERIRQWTDRWPSKSNADDWKESSKRTARLDRIFTHPIWGHVILAGVFFALFQAVYAWSAYPMDLVDTGFSWVHRIALDSLPETWWRSLILDGLLNGLGGIIVFVPQIMILFGLISAMEATGYMARVGFLGDQFLQRIGLNGRSIVPLVGGLACAVPAVMAARSITGKRERLLTILVTPLMTCSARLPVYAFLIGFLVPDKHIIGGLFNQQGLFLFGLYAVSTFAALALAWLMHRALPKRQEGSFTMEWPAYRLPKLWEVLQEMASKGWDFVRSAGQVILIVSLILWGLGKVGPSGTMDKAKAQYALAISAEDKSAGEAAIMEASWLGQLGHFIEPAVRPLGYDGRIGIAILSSFAAREVFVGTMSTLFPGEQLEEGSIRSLQKRLGTEVHPTTGKPLLNPASAASLLVFYMFAMQCMSTVVIVRKELNSWPWALGQAIGFTLLAYGMALLVYQVMSL
jgi:ferrous iron transport protein B